MFNPKTQFRAVLSLLPVLLLPVSSGFGAPAPTIGIATANGKFTLNRANHRNNATLFEGNTFDSGSSELEFRLASGTIVQLGASARGAIYSSRIMLAEGGGDVHSSPSYSVEALGLQVKSEQKDAVARVVVSDGHVQVGALRGELKVWNDKGVLVATIHQGEGDAFTPLTENMQATAPAAGGAAAGGAAAGGAAAAGAATGSAAAGGVIAAGTAVAGVSGAMVVAGVAVVAVGAATGISVAAASANADPTLSPSVR